MANYTDKKRIGTGGFGDVWLCERDTDGQRFAKKKLRTPLPEIVERFTREVRIIESLDHPNIIKVVAKRLTKGPSYFFIMPHYHHSMATVLKELIGNTSRCTKVFNAILDAIEYAHSEGVIHRDLKPANVLMNSDDDLVVSDFGLGRILDAKSTRRTGTGVKMGTECYAAPEQWSDAKAADERSDVFSLGRILYELHTSPLTSGHQDTSALPTGIALLVNRCTAADPKKRFQTVTELKEAWLMISGQADELAPSEEVMSLIGELSARSTVNKSKSLRLIHMLSHVLDDPDLIHNVVMKLPATVLSAMAEQDVDFTRQLIRAFVSHAGPIGWPFSYTDKITVRCKSLHDAIDDPIIRSDLLLCTLQVGENHSRWAVLATFDELVNRTRTAVENLALAERLSEVSPHMRGAFAKRVPANRLNAKIQAVLKK